jgi:hypothetical protein
MAWVGWAWAGLCFMGLANLGMRVAGWHGPSYGPMGQTALALYPRILWAEAFRALVIFREQVAPSGSAGLSASPSDSWLTAR